MTKHVHVSSLGKAWEEAMRLLPEGVSRDEKITRIYWGTGNRHVVDLGGQIEVNHGVHGELTTMVWIDRHEDEPECSDADGHKWETIDDAAEEHEISCCTKCGQYRRRYLAEPKRGLPAFFAYPKSL